MAYLIEFNTEQLNYSSLIVPLTIYLNLRKKLTTHCHMNNNILGLTSLELVHGVRHEEMNELLFSRLNK